MWTTKQKLETETTWCTLRLLITKAFLFVLKYYTTTKMISY